MEQLASPYPRITHVASYPDILPCQPALSTAGKVVAITGASGSIGRATALSFAESHPKALILLGRRTTALADTATRVRISYPSILMSIVEVELTKATPVRDALIHIATEHGGIDILIHSADDVAPVQPLLQADPTTFMDGYKTTVLGALVIAQAVVLANKEASADKSITFVNLTSRTILFKPQANIGAFISSKMAALKLLEAFAAENLQVRLHHVYPGLVRTATSAKLEEGAQMPFIYPGIPLSLPADFLVWVVSPEAEFLKDKIVWATWDVNKLKAHRVEIIGRRPGAGELSIVYQGFQRYTPQPGIQ